MKNINLKGFCLVAALSFAVLPIFVASANAEEADAPISQEDAEFAAAVGAVDAALASNDVDLIATAVANAVKNNPTLAGRFAAYVALKNPEASLAAIDAVGEIAPDQFAAFVSAATTELAKNPSNETILAQALTKTTPAAGGKNNKDKEDKGKKEKKDKSENPNHNSERE